MTRVFQWTPKRDDLLRDLYRARFTVAELARAIGTDAASVKHRMQALHLIRKPGADRTLDVATVPRPIGAAPRRTPSPPRPEPTGVEPGTTDTTARLRMPPTRHGRADTAEQAPDRQVGASPAVRPTRRSALIDLSRVPSSMEQQAERWAGRE